MRPRRFSESLGRISFDTFGEPSRGWFRIAELALRLAIGKPSSGEARRLMKIYRLPSWHVLTIFCLATAVKTPMVAFCDDATHRRHQADQKTKGPPAVTPPVRDPQHTFQLGVRDWVELKQRNIVMQRRDYSCGAAALATLAKYYWGDDVDEDLFLRALDSILTEEEIADRIENGLAMSDLRRAAVRVGYQAVVGKLTFAKLTEARVPVVVGISPEGHDHFVVYRGTHDGWVYVADPIRGNVRMPIREFTKQWQENAVLAIHKPGQKVRTTSPLHVSEAEKRLGETNDHLIRTQPQREAAVPKQGLRR
jgi:predicted double-glycine peptidase